MTALTPAAALATRIAAHEASMAKAGTLEKEHLFIGLLSLDKALDKDEQEKSGTSDVAKEHAAISCLLEITGLDATVLRRLMRQALGSSDHPLTGSTIHRSPGCRNIFTRASVLADGKPASCIHLFSAVMEKPGTVIAGVLAESRRCRAALRETDVLLPSGTGFPGASRSCAGTFDLPGELAGEIARTRVLLGMLPEGSGEYPMVRKALVRQLISIAILCLDTGDRAGLVSALREIAGMAGDRKEMIMTACRDIETLKINEYGLSKEIKNRIRCLLPGLDEQAGDGPGA
jgi:hypothetical protein